MDIPVLGVQLVVGDLRYSCLLWVDENGEYQGSWLPGCLVPERCYQKLEEQCGSEKSGAMRDVHLQPVTGHDALLN